MLRGFPLLDVLDLALAGAGLGLLVVAAVQCRRCVWSGSLRGSLIRANALSPILVWFCMFAYLAGGLVGFFIARPLVSRSLAEPVRRACEGVLASSVSQVIAVATCLIVARGAFRAGLRGFGLGWRSSRSDGVWIIGGWLVALSLCGAVVQYTSWVIAFFWPGYEPPDHSVFTALKASEIGQGMRVLAVFSAAILAPLGEEIFFRGILQTAIRKLIPARQGSLRHRWIAIVVTAAGFGFMHSNTPHFIPALIALGIILGYLYERRGSLLTPILVHILFNAKSLLWYHLQGG